MDKKKRERNQMKGKIYGKRNHKRKIKRNGKDKEIER